MARLKPSTWNLIAAAAVAAILLLIFPIRLSPSHALSLAALPALAVALLAGPVPAAIIAAGTALAALPLHALTMNLGALLLAAPLLGLLHQRCVHPAVACLLLPAAAASVGALLTDVDRLGVLTSGALQGAVSVIGAYALALAATAHVPRARGGWAGRRLTHRLFVILAGVATLLTVGMGALSARHLQERQAQTSLASLQLLALEIAESSQVLLEAYGRALAAFGNTLQHADLSHKNAQLSRLVDAYTSGQTVFQTVLVARDDGQVLAAAATRRSLDMRRVIGRE